MTLATDKSEHCFCLGFVMRFAEYLFIYNNYCVGSYHEVVLVDCRHIGVCLLGGDILRHFLGSQCVGV